MWNTFARLGTYLAAQGRAGTHRLTLTFGELEAILGRPLPLDARVDPAWWANTSQPNKTVAGPWYGWLSVGWEAEPDLLHGAVTFRRRGEDSAVTSP